MNKYLLRVTWKMSMGIEGIRRNFEEVGGRRWNYSDGSVAQGGTKRNYADQSVPPSCNHEFETVFDIRQRSEFMTGGWSN